MENRERLQKIYNSVSDYIASSRDMFVSTQRLLAYILELSNLPEVEEEDLLIEEKQQDKEKEDSVINEILISCDASIKVNPGGPSAVGMVIRFPPGSKIKPIELAKHTPSKTNNEAEYDAIYEALLTLVNLFNSPPYPVVIHSDSQLVVKQLTGEYAINNESLKKKSESIHELCRQIPVPVRIEWHSRNSTRDLAQANFIAQDLLEVRRH